MTHLLWFFVFEVVDVEIKRAGDGQTQMGHRGDQSHPGGPLLNNPIVCPVRQTSYLLVGSVLEEGDNLVH